MAKNRYKSPMVRTIEMDFNSILLSGSNEYQTLSDVSINSGETTTDVESRSNTDCWDNEW